MKRSIRVIVAALMMLSVMATPAQAGVSERFTINVGLAYQADGYVLLTGPPVEQGCFGEGFPETELHLVFPENGSVHENWKQDGVGFYLFEADSVGALLDEVCSAIAAGEEPLAPVGIGEGQILAVARGDAGGTFHVTNSAIGAVTDTDGNTWSVNARAKFSDGPDGFDLQSETIKMGAAH